jgi:thiamine-monophosphate kinase
MDNNKKQTPISEIGKTGLLQKLLKGNKLLHKTSVSGFGDDAAIIEANGKQLVLTTNLMTEGIDFNLLYFPLKHLGYKAVTRCASKTYAMNAKPAQLTVSLAVSVKFSVEMIEMLFEGIKLACNNYQVDLMDIDITSSITGLIISISTIGEAEPEQVTCRNNAQSTDLVCVSGNLGAAYMGLQLLEREKNIFSQNQEIQPDFSGFKYILSRQLKPEARKDIIEKLHEINIVPTTMTDITEGCASDIIKICQASNLGCKLYEDKMPIDTETAKMAEELHIEPLICALNGGEDYELLFTVPLEKFEELNNIPEISIIGHMTFKKDGYSLITRDGRSLPLIYPDFG